MGRPRPGPVAGPGLPDTGGEAAASTAARGILDRVRPPTMIQIEGFFGTNTAEAARVPGARGRDHDQILPPALLWCRELPFDGFTAELADLRTRTDAKRAFVEREDPSPDEDDSD